ncbi:MAG: sulfotransferase domain-containing protein [Gammaproteobacteria bacterium]|nr:sulfotransferase domain-containing protein [Gammaproteobacteria bacterium]
MPAGQPREKTPLVDFVIVGAQKCGTTALGQFLARHPEIGMSSQKEVHLFDQPDYAPGTTAAEIDARYRRYFAHVSEAKVRGEATPIYMYLPGVAAELKRYNPDIKLIVLLRDPVERALSAYYMQRARARETKPLWLALLLEPWRLRRDRDVRRWRSAAREHGYRSRGLYSLQLRELYRHFEQRRILIVRCDDLRDDHDATLRRVLAFLDVSTAVRIPPEIVFGGQAGRRPHRSCRAILKLSYAVEYRRQRRLGVG